MHLFFSGDMVEEVLPESVLDRPDIMLTFFTSWKKAEPEKRLANVQKIKRRQRQKQKPPQKGR